MKLLWTANKILELWVSSLCRGSSTWFSRKRLALSVAISFRTGYSDGAFVFCKQMKKDLILILNYTNVQTL